MRITKKQANCRFCHFRPVTGTWRENAITLASGAWSSIDIGMNPSGDIVIRGVSDEYTDDYHPKFCPECGRDLTK